VAITATHSVIEKGAPTRSEPDGKAKTTGRLDGGTGVELMSTDGTWSQVRSADGVTAWVSNRSLTAISGAAPAPSPEPAAAAVWSATHTIPDGGLPARAKPDPSLDPLLRIKSDTGVRMVEEEGAWARVTIESGWEAWVDGRRLVPIAGAAPAVSSPAQAPEAAPEPAPAPAPEPAVWKATHVIPDGGLSAWSEPKADRQPILRVKNGTEVQVVSTTGAWSRIRTEAGWEAWVDGRRLVDAG
jgi:SH3-like domain-containing protein